MTDTILSVWCWLFHGEHWHVLARFRRGACVEKICRQCGRVWCEGRNSEGL